MAKQKSSNGTTEKIVETPAERFMRLAPRRVAACLAKIKQVGNLANEKVYEFTPAQRDKIVNALTDAVAATCAAFEGQAQENVFQL